MTIVGRSEVSNADDEPATDTTHEYTEAGNQNENEANDSPLLLCVAVVLACYLEQ